MQLYIRKSHSGKLHNSHTQDKNSKIYKYNIITFGNRCKNDRKT